MAGETLEPESGRTIGIPWNRLPFDSETAQGFATVLPVILLYLVIAVAPVTFALYASFYSIPLMNPTWEFVGLQNYLEVLRLDRFWASLWRGVVYMVGSTLFQLVVGLWMALALNRLDRGQKIVTAVVFSAYLVPIIVVSLLGLFMFDTFTGVLHVIGSDWFGLWGTEEFVLGNQDWAMGLLILLGSWKYSVFIAIFTLAQLTAIPSRFYEASKVCGANKWEMFRDITLPRLKGVLLVAVLLRSIFMFNKFDIFWQTTQGGPGYATTTLPVLTYRETFIGGSYGVGNAMAIIMFLFLAAAALMYFRAFDPSEEVQT
ncbi:sugar ABC transporter permease [Halobacteriales archaeon QS_3_64_16]|nr:MAG: sugar ABC transporter permease [Halobacteriales archaeon QS_3_64_16]